MRTAAGVVEEISQVSCPFQCDLIAGFHGPAPLEDRGAGVRCQATKPLDDQVAFITHLFERADEGGEVEVAGAWDAAVVFAEVKVTQRRAKRAARGGNVLLLDVGVEGVDQDADAGIVDRFAELRRVGRGGEEEGFTEVDGFKREGHLATFERLAELLEGLDGPAPLVFGAAAARKVADRSIHGAAYQLCSEFRRSFDASAQMCLREPANRSVRRDGIDS